MNHNKSRTSDDPEVIKAVHTTLMLLQSGYLDKALEAFTLILKKNYSNSIAESGIKCCKFWVPRLAKADDITEHCVKGNYLYGEWKKFEDFSSSLKYMHPKVAAAVMVYIFNTILETLKEDIYEHTVLDIQTCFLIGICYKKLGDFKNAVRYFEETIKNDKTDANAFAQLADCYALIDEGKKAKILFREAFFLDPGLIDLEELDSNIIHTLITKTLECNIRENQVAHWLPVYGRVLDIFTVKRELLPVELGRLKQDIFHLEQAGFNSNNGQEMDMVKPKLLNCYLWLYDYFLIKKSKAEILTEIENKIKIVSEDIYNLLINYKQETK